MVLVTCPAEASEKVARAALDARTAACANILPNVKSLYWWEGRVEEAAECLLLFKARTSQLGELERAVRGAHPYDVPEMIALPVTRGFSPYLEWIESVTGPARRPPARRP